MKQKIYLHIGTPKTGTSAIQKFLLENTEELAKQNFVYPKHHLDSNNISSGNGQEIIVSMLNGKKEDALNQLNKILAENKDKNIIFSSENFYRHPKLVYELFPEAKIIVYFREQLQQAQSSYNQSVKRHYQTNSFSVALKATLRTNDSFYSSELIEEWVELYGVQNVIFRIYEPNDFVKESIYCNFINAIEADFNKNFKIIKNRINVSYTRDVLEYKLLLNRLMKENSEKLLHKEIDMALQKYSQEEDLKETPMYELYTKEEKKIFQDFYLKSNDLLKKLFFDNEKKTLFTNTLENDYLEYKGLKIFKIVEITRYIINFNVDTLSLISSMVFNGLSSPDNDVKLTALKLSPILSMPKVQKHILKQNKRKEV